MNTFGKVLLVMICPYVSVAKLREKEEKSLLERLIRRLW